MRILKNAGISPKGFADFFERVAPKRSPGKEKANDAESRFLTIFSTHPLSKARLALVQAQPPYPVNPVLSDSDWQALRQICGPPGARQRQKGSQQRP